MNEAAAYRVLLAVHDGESDLDAWLRLAVSFLPENGEVLLRGMVNVPVDQSLSEGATQAREMRDALEYYARQYDMVYDETEVRVDYQPLLRVLNELNELPVDLLLVQWAGPTLPTGGLSTEEILQQAPCDVVLVSGTGWQESGPVLLSLRGGPNMTLGLQVARALAADSTITLFHAAESKRAAPNLQAFIEAEEHRIARTVTAVGSTIEGLLKEAPGHKAIVLGASAMRPELTASSVETVTRRVYERTTIPLVVVRAWRPEELPFHRPRLRHRPAESISVKVDRWFAENSFHSSEFADLQALVDLKEKQGVTISIGLPALNEEKTVGKVIATLKTALMDEVPLVDEIVLFDSNSTDNTVAIAEACGIPAYRHPEILPEMGTYQGKGEALWKSLYVLKGDIIAWVDTDITNIHPRFIYGLVGPLLKRPGIQYVKGFYQRPIRVGDQLQAYGGGRVTELVARPMLNLYYPELSGIVQPLSGEYAGRREALEQVPFFSGYGVETGLCIDIFERFGLEAIAQCDLEQRVHHNQPLIGLSKMSFAILQVFISRLDNRYGSNLSEKANHSMKLVAHGQGRFALDIAEIGDIERPPMIMVPAYQKKRMEHLRGV